MSLAAIIALGGRFDAWTVEQLNGIQIPAHERFRHASACYQVAQEHATAVRVLLDRHPTCRLPSPAFALVRCAWEAYIRGQWLLLCATDAQVSKFIAKGELPVGMRQAVAAVETKRDNTGFYTNMHDKAWGVMNDYTHGGPYQTKRRLTADQITASFPEDVMASAVGLSLMFSIFASAELAQLGNRRDLLPAVGGFVDSLNETSAMHLEPGALPTADAPS